MRKIPAKTILSGYMEQGWFASNYNMNLYKGCCHGCIYCDSRSECYGIEGFDEVRTKENALGLLECELRSKRKKGVIISGSMSDSYNPFEKIEQLTRGALERIDRYGYGVVIDTKSDLVLRDIDILSSIKSHSPAIVNFTITCAEDALCSLIEPHVCVSSARFEAMRVLSQAGIMTGVLLMPILPFINDTEENILTIVRLAHQSGASYIYSGFGVTLRQNQRDYFFQQLDALFPGLKQQYIARYGMAYSCSAPNASRLWQVFQKECDALGLLYRMEDISRLIGAKYRVEQLSLF